MPNEDFPAAETQSMARLLRGLVLLFLRHYKGVCVCWRTPGNTPWLDGIWEGRMERVVLPWGCHCMLACRFQKSLRGDFRCPFLALLPRIFSLNWRDMDLMGGLFGG